MIPGPRQTALRVARDFLTSPAFAQALATSTVALLLFSFTIDRAMGQPALIAAATGAAMLAALSLAARAPQLEWTGLPPISLLMFVGWCGLTVFWSQYQWATLGGWLHLVLVALLAAHVALARDLIQVVRIIGDVLRLFLGLSLALEIFAGLLIDAPIPHLGIEGAIASDSPTQGLGGDAEALGLLAVIAIITFTVERATRSVPRMVSTASLVLGATVLLFGRTPLTLLTAAVVAVGAVALAGARVLHRRKHSYAEVALASAAVAVAVLAYALRRPLIELTSAHQEVAARLFRWNQVESLLPLNSLEGFGWLGPWRLDLPPYVGVLVPPGTPLSAMNAALDLWLQAGLVGLVAAVAVAGLALVRSWLVATARRSVAHAWPALVLLALVVDALGASRVLAGWPWFLVVLCSILASRELSWRRGLR